MKENSFYSQARELRQAVQSLQDKGLAPLSLQPEETKVPRTNFTEKFTQSMEKTIHFVDGHPVLSGLGVMSVINIAAFASLVDWDKVAELIQN